mgnify:CR=1 FL=1
MEEQKFKVIIVEDVKLELKGTEEIFRHEIPNAEVIGTAMTESEFWPLMEAQLPDLVLLDWDWEVLRRLALISAGIFSNVIRGFVY